RASWHQHVSFARAGGSRLHPAVANPGVSMFPKFQTTEPGVRLKGPFAMRWRVFMRGRAEERAVASRRMGAGRQGASVAEAEKPNCPAVPECPGCRARRVKSARPRLRHDR